MPVGGLLPLPYCLSREFLARDTRGYASVEGTYAHVYVGTDTTPPLFLNRRQQQYRTVTDREPMVVSVTVAAPPPSSTPAGGLYLTRLRSLCVESASEHGCGGIRTQVEEGLNMLRRLDFHGTI